MKLNIRVNLKQHKMSIHKIDVVYHTCDVPGCQYKAIEKGNLKKHVTNVHDIDANYHHCDIPGCKYKAKQKVHLKKHKKLCTPDHVRERQIRQQQANHHCDVSGCKFKTKYKKSL